MVMLFSLLFSFLLAQEKVAAPHVDIQFINAHQDLLRGEENHIAFLFDIDKDWHIYWQNPGDSGREPRLKWLENGGLNISKFIWPSPKKVPLASLVNYGYENKVALPLKVTIPKNFSKEKVTLKAQLDWLICKVECIPGKAILEKDFTIANQSQPSAYYQEIQKSLNRVPLNDKNILATFQLAGEKIKLSFDFTNVSVPKIQSAYFFPKTELAVEYSDIQRYEWKDGLLEMQLSKNLNIDPNITQLKGVLELVPENPNLPKIPYNINAIREGQNKGATTLWIALIFAFIGGLILNLMPCVFPVISLKILGFVHQEKDNKRKIRNHGWYYTFGILTAFWILTIILVLLRSSGEAVGWGFQLQSPYFVTAMAFLFFFIGLNLLGLFEIGDSLSAIDKGPRKKGYWSSFQTGILATIVATPCTAPFMGVAIGAVLTMPTYATYLVFTSLAFGLAFPYLILSYFPQWLKLLPKPGLWMKKLKELLAFPMFLTMLWLLWVLEQQTDSFYIILLLLSLLSIYFLFWIHSYYKKPKILWLILGAALITFTFMQIPHYSHSAKEQRTSDGWQAYSEEALQNHLNQGRSVFIDFTASWCITCQVNKKMVLHSQDVKNFFKENDIVTMQADWTNHNDNITNKLAEFGRNSVPLYVYYPSDGGDPIVLPEILSKDMILELNKK